MAAEQTGEAQAASVNKALEIYKKIKKDYVNSPVRRDIDKYIERETK